MTPTPINDLEYELREIDKRRSLLETLGESVGSNPSLENELAHLNELRRIAVRLLAVAKQLEATEPASHLRVADRTRTEHDCRQRPATSWP
jgi:hypothetical protein